MGGAGGGGRAAPASLTAQTSIEWRKIIDEIDDAAAAAEWVIIDLQGGPFEQVRAAGFRHRALGSRARSEPGELDGRRRRFGIAGGGRGRQAKASGGPYRPRL
jgi:hypothetical protein